jgi:hypothetical protein
MYLRAKKRIKDGKEHRYWSIVESCRNLDGRVVQRQVLYLGEINDSQKTAWCRTIEVLQVDSSAKQMALFPADRPAPELECEVVQVKLNELRLHHPRQWGACWLALTLWEQLELDRFWRDRLPASRQGTKWLEVLKTQVCYQLIDPGSEWRLHRHWYAHSAMRDLLGSPVRVLSDDTLYRCLDKLLAHKRAFFSFLRQRWEVLFQARFDVLLYDLTSTYFESDPPFAGKRQFGYSRDKRSDCVQVVIALVVTPQGFPLAYEVMPGNTSDNTTLAGFLEKIENQYGRSDRVWIMDRGIPTEATLATMREGDAPVHSLVGTPKGRLTKLETSFLGQPWQAVRPCVEVKLLAEEGELYILVHSESRVLKERSMRRRRLKKLWQRLHELRHQSNRRDQLLLKLGSAKKEAGRAWHLVDIRVPETGKPITSETFTFALRRDRLRQARRREGRYLLRSNMTGEDPATLWKYYMRLTEIEQAFKELKHDLAIRPIFHQREERIEAHIFVSFLAYCLLVTLKNLARPRAPGLTPRAILEKFSTIQMVDVHLPTTDGRRLVLPRHTRANQDHELLLHQLGLKLPEQPAPRLLV